MIIGLHFFQPSKKKEAYSMAEVSIFSFFAGCGILDLAFETSNFNIVFVNEFSPVFMEGYQFARGRLELPAPEYGFHNDSAERYSKRKGLAGFTMTQLPAAMALAKGSMQSKKG